MKVYSKRKFARKYKKRVFSRTQVKAIGRIAQKRINRKIETKSAPYSSSFVNNLANSNGLFYDLISRLNTATGLPQGTAENQRVGDKVTVRGIKLRLCLTNMYADSPIQGSTEKISVRVIIFGTKDTSPTKGSLLRANSFALVQEVDTDENRVIYDRIHSVHVTSTLAGTWTHTNVKIWVPGTKIGRKGVLQFQDNSATAVKGYNYYMAIIPAYPGDGGLDRIDVLWNGVFYFKDA